VGFFGLCSGFLYALDALASPFVLGAALVRRAATRAKLE